MSQPPYRPPGFLPPFPPTLAGRPPAFPPFPPGASPNFRPPFPPNFSPNNHISPPHPLQSPLPVRPVPGLPQAPTPPRPAAPPTFVKENKTTSVFVGGIAPGVKDSVLIDLLNACGPLHELKRVSGANGKPQAFGFALFQDPSAVMRCIRCLNGVELPDSTGKSVKALVVKVDEKTKGFLDEFEQTMGRTEEDEAADATSRKAVAHIVARLTDPNAPLPPGMSRPVDDFQVIVPAHLQDLKEGDLPENQRVAVLDQIAVFRENAARKEREKKMSDTDRDRPAASSDYGYGNRALPNGRRDPQAYSEPVPFVKAQAPETKVESGRTDKEEEDLRVARKARERDYILRDRERKVENRERHRIEAVNRELAFRQQQDEYAIRDRKLFKDRVASLDLGVKELTRWREQRQGTRTREYQDDVRDRQAEQEELRRVQQESEAFLEKQLAELNALEAADKNRGLLSEDATPIRLALARPEVPEQVAPLPRPTIALEGDDDEGTVAKKHRTFVRLEDDAAAGMSEAERSALLKAKLFELRESVPSDPAVLYNVDIASAINETTLRGKIVPFVNARLVDYLGEADADIVELVLEMLRSKSDAASVIEELEGPLGDEANQLVTHLWRQLAFEAAAKAAQLDTGTMTV